MRRLLIEGMGWILTLIGAYFLFGDLHSQPWHWVVFALGIILIIFNIPIRGYLLKLKLKRQERKK